MSLPEHLTKQPGNQATGAGSTELPGAHYQIRRPIVALVSKDDHHAAVTLPLGKVIHVVRRAEEDDRFLVVEVDDQQFQVFETDLVERCSVRAERTLRGDGALNPRVIPIYPNSKDRQRRAS